MLKNGKEEVLFLKNLVIDSDEEEEGDRENDSELEIEMVKIN